MLKASDKTRKEIIKVFKEIEFKIDIKTNLKEVNFLDVNFDLQKCIYQLLKRKKTNDNRLYVHIFSKHPSTIITQIPQINSSNESILKNSYETALWVFSKTNIHKK